MVHEYDAGNSAPEHSEEPDYESSDARLVQPNVGEVLNPGDCVKILTCVSTSQDRCAHLITDDSPLDLGGSASVCIYVRRIGFQYQFVAAKGYFYILPSPSLRGTIVPGLVSSATLEPVLPYLPTEVVTEHADAAIPVPTTKSGPLPISVVEPIVAAIESLQTDIIAFERRYKYNFEHLYEKLADEHETTEWSLTDIGLKGFGIPHDRLSIAGVLAIHDFASSKDNGIFNHRHGRTDDTFHVYSRRHQRLFGEVRSWAREYQEMAAKEASLGHVPGEDSRQHPLRTFIEKAHRLILLSRKIRSPTTLGNLGPSAECRNEGIIAQVDPGVKLTANDRKILAYLDFVQMQGQNWPEEAKGVRSLILRAIGAYPNMVLGLETGDMFLQELGLHPPWPRMARPSSDLRLPGPNSWPSQERLVAQAEASVKDLSTFTDRLSHLRKDWGQLPVYCIDSPNALELDDGISIERDGSNPSRVWIHVHIANPAAYISRDHPIAQASGMMLESWYSPSKRIGMMPSEFATKLAGVAKDRPVITVSTLIERDGSVNDVVITLGVVHNVIRLDTKAVESALGARDIRAASLAIGPEMPAPKIDRSQEIAHKIALDSALPELHLALDHLQQWYLKCVENWPEQDRYAFQKPAPKVISVRTNFSDERTSVGSSKLVHWRGDPSVTIESEFGLGLGNHSQFVTRNLVGLAMSQAGQGAAKWCKERHIPVLYHSQVPHPHFPVSKLRELADDLTKYRVSLIPEITPVPKPFFGLMFDQYMKITSPLRRYSDLINQWQIQAYLESSENQGRPGTVNHSFESLQGTADLPFTTQELSSLTVPLSKQLIGLMDAKRRDQQKWLIYALFRGHHFPNTSKVSWTSYSHVAPSGQSPAASHCSSLPKVWDFQINMGRHVWKVDPETAGISGQLRLLRVHAELLRSEQGWENTPGIKPGMFLPVELVQANPLTEKVTVRAVGPPTEEPMEVDPIT